jgi:inner membrane protein
MLYSTHICFALFLEGKTTLLNLTLATFGSLFPDLDSATGKLSKATRNCGENLKHRGILHTPFLTTVIFAIYYIIFRNLLILPFIMGMFSHIFLDFLTTKGVMIFYPLSKQRFHIIGIKTGSLFEKLLSVIFFLGFLLRFFQII